MRGSEKILCWWRTQITVEGMMVSSLKALQWGKLVVGQRIVECTTGGLSEGVERSTAVGTAEGARCDRKSRGSGSVSAEHC